MTTARMKMSFQLYEIIKIDDYKNDKSIKNNNHHHRQNNYKTNELIE